ncbi:hypothetical protein RRG08_022575 [Elysia crispata]|uniref:Uncharacterized protein n=1 Tax=Elysia crispata TaxID=231223 RepID=A0AAE1D8A1_9GAST|nr:hypothetical protein RRG08_022575 [Elysia crispata]
MGKINTLCVTPDQRFLPGVTELNVSVHGLPPPLVFERLNVMPGRQHGYQGYMVAVWSLFGRSIPRSLPGATTEYRHPPREHRSLLDLGRRKGETAQGSALIFDSLVFSVEMLD